LTVCLGEGINRDALLLQDFARVLAIPLCAGCDLLDVMERRFFMIPSFRSMSPQA